MADAAEETIAAPPKKKRKSPRTKGKRQREGLPPQNMTTTEVAALLDLDERRIQQLVKINVLPRVKAGRYPWRDCVHAYIRYLREGAGIGDPDAARDKKATSATKRKLLELRLKREEGKVVDVDAAERAIFARARRVRTIVSSAAPVIASRGASRLGVPMPTLLTFLEEELRTLGEAMAKASRATAIEAPTPADEPPPDDEEDEDDS